MPERVVEPLRTELIEKVISNCKPKAGLDRALVGQWVDLVCVAINERIEEHAPGMSARSATPTEDATD